MHTPEQLEYIKKHKLVALTSEVDPLYLSRVHGAVTVGRAMELDALYSAYYAARLKKTPHDHKLWDTIVSDELSLRNEGMIDRFGCGQF